MLLPERQVRAVDLSVAVGVAQRPPTPHKRREIQKLSCQLLTPARSPAAEHRQGPEAKQR